MNLAKTGVIFDMDGVLVVNMDFHKQAFYEFGKRYGKEINHDFFLKHISGSTNERIMPKIFGDLSDEDVKRFSDEKEAIYRDLYSPHMILTPGLNKFLTFLEQLSIPIAIASNAPQVNIEYVINKLDISKYITATFNSLSVANPKPAPDMFLYAAKVLKRNPSDCIVFEDAPSGIKAARQANMKAVSVLTSHKAEEFEKADLFINDFNDKELYSFLKEN